MGKSRRSATRRKGSGRRNELVGAIVEARSDLLGLVMNAGFGVLGALLEEDRAQLCGARHARGEERRAYRHGYDEGSLVLGGRRVKVRKPRARSLEGEEMTLPHWEAFKGTDPLGERALEQVLCGVTTRKYERSLETLPDELAASGTSKSSVSRRFVARTSQQVGKYLSRPLDEIDLPAIVIDGTQMAKHLLVIAIGIDTDGHKHVLGVVEGSTESAAVGRALLRQLIERGLPVERARLIVMDGSKGLRKAVRDTFGDWALIQRCRVHKLNNVLEHLPRHIRPWFAAKIRKAFKAGTNKQAGAKLLSVARELELAHPGAAASLREGLEETLTLNRLGLDPEKALLKTLRSTNIIENLNGALKHTTRNVKRWRSGSMVLRWAVTALMEAEKNFRRVRGYREIPMLDVALNAEVAAKLDKERLSA